MQINGDKRTDYDDGVCGVRTTADIWHKLFESPRKVIAHGFYVLKCSFLTLVKGIWEYFFF